MVLPDEQLADLAVKANLADAKKLVEAYTYVKHSNVSLEDALLELKITTDDQLGQAVAAYLKIPFVALSKVSIPEDVFDLVPPVVARKQKAVAFARDPTGVKIALANPQNAQLVDFLAKKTGQKVFVHYATFRDIQATLHLFKKDLQVEVDNLLKEDIGRPTGTDDPPVAKIVDLLIDTAYEEKASDIHIEPQEANSFIRFRVDGMLQDVLAISKFLHERVITRIKVLSNLRTDENLAAQDGKMRVPLEEENLDIRVSILPIVDGEKAVLRLLSSRSRQYTLQNLGMNDVDLQKVYHAYSKSYGMILSTGPTGSGKTTSIYSILKILNTREKNITTVEDPVEYRIMGANQVQVNTKTNLTFASGLRSILRQDPNIIFVGEIRDSETAGIAVNAALTGHLVVSTLHTNDAATAIPRLTDMKVEPFLVASTVTVVVAQRLVRRTCPSCKTEMALTFEELAKNFPGDVLKRNDIKKSVTVYKGKGCKICRNSDYSRRVGLFEVLEITPEVRKLIAGKSDADVIARAAVGEGMKTMLDDGIAKILLGETTVEEVLRVTKAEFL